MDTPHIKLNLRIYLILAGIALLTAVLFLTHTQYFQQFSHNQATGTQFSKWKNQAVVPPNLSGSSITLIYDSKEEYSVLLKKQIARTLKDLRKPVNEIDLQTKQPDWTTDGEVIWALTDLSLLQDSGKLSDYVEQGGRLFFATMPEPDESFMKLYRKLGILDFGDFSDEKGLQLDDEVLIGEKGLQIHDDFMTNTVMEVELDSSAKVHASTLSGLPLMWSHESGKGSVMVFNGTMLQEKINRGIIVGAVSMMVPDFVYPIYNSKLMYIDDWPAPYGSSIDPDIYKTYRMNRQDFFKQVWWPDMLKAAKRYGIDYTAVMIESYHNQVEPLFASPTDADPEGLISYGREIIKSGGEIGLHGYNHQSLTTDVETSRSFEYEPWRSAEDMGLSVEEALSYFKRSFPSYSVFSYVPPSNVLSDEGRETVSKHWKDLAVISSTFPDDSTGLSYVQEFGQAPDGVLEMPRVTSGYDDEDFERWTAASVLTAYGFFSHFVHPDDVLDKERSKGMGWPELYEDYEKILSRLQSKYPWLESKTSVEAANDMNNMLSGKLELKQSERLIEGRLEPLQGEASFILRTRKHIDSTKGCTVTEIGDGILLIRAKRPEFTIHLSEA